MYVTGSSLLKTGIAAMLRSMHAIIVLNTITVVMNCTSNNFIIS